MERDLRIDVARIICALLVVYIHYDVRFVSAYTTTELLPWIIADTANSIGRIAVPAFIMMSGALVIGRPIHNVKTYYLDKTAKVMKPYFAASVIYILIGPTMGFPWKSPSEMINQLLTGTAAYHLYFLPILFVMYMVAPLLQRADEIPTKHLAIVTAALFMLAALDRHLNPMGWGLGYFSLGTTPTYIPYFLGGYLLYRRWQMSFEMAFAGFFLTTCFTILVVWAYATPQNFYPYKFESLVQYTSINVIAQSIFAFGVVCNLKPKSWGIPQDLIMFLADKTLGIFLIHFALSEWTYNFMRWFDPNGSAPELTLMPVVLFMVSAALVTALHKVPRAKGFL